MEGEIYKRAKLKHGIWVSIALFFVIFYSCPVKKYIQIRLGQLQEMPAIKSVAPQTPNTVNKICNINRHTLVQKIVPPDVQQLPNLDPAVLFLLSSLLAFLGLLYLDDRFLDKQHGQAHLFGPPIPLYLQIHKLQV